MRRSVLHRGHTEGSVSDRHSVVLLVIINAHHARHVVLNCYQGLSAKITQFTLTHIHTYIHIQ